MCLISFTLKHRRRTSPGHGLCCLDCEICSFDLYLEEAREAILFKGNEENRFKARKAWRISPRRWKAVDTFRGSNADPNNRANSTDRINSIEWHTALISLVPLAGCQCVWKSLKESSRKTYAASDWATFGPLIVELRSYKHESTSRRSMLMVCWFTIAYSSVLLINRRSSRTVPCSNSQLLSL